MSEAKDDPARGADARAFLSAAGWGAAARGPLAGDASNRRYERLRREDGRAAVLMDAPPETGEDVRPFAALTAHLRDRGFSAPEIYAADPARGFLLLEDLGDALFARRAREAPAQEAEMYAAAVALLAALHDEPPPAVAGRAPAHAIPDYAAATLLREARLFVDWWLPGVDADPAPEEAETFDAALAAACAAVAESRAALALRDYHAENLIWLPERVGVARVGLLDYQDALRGHPAYDLVSLLEDARRDVAPELVQAAMALYLDRAAVAPGDRAAFRAAYDVLGAQRNLKIMGIFARLALRDRKPAYLAHIPRVWAHLRRDLAQPSSAPLARWMAARDAAPTPERLARLATRAAQGDLAGRRAASPRRPDPDAPRAAMVLAAGLGTRMRPLTDATPKPLLRAGGRTLLDHALDRIEELGVPAAVVNAHYLADQVIAHLDARARPAIRISDERAERLETGGGVKRALPLLDGAALFVVNSDNLWLGPRALQPLLDGWRPEAMDALLLLTPIENAVGYVRAGDFFRAPDGRLARRGEAPRAPFVYTGAQIIARRAFAETPDGPFSLNLVWDRLIASGRAFGCVHPGRWIDVGTPEGLVEADRLLRDA